MNCNIWGHLLLLSISLTSAFADDDAGSCTASDVGNYSMKWHVSSVFIVLVASGVGTFTTLLLGTKDQKPIRANALQLFKMFGIGVIAATGWCHLLPDAFDRFSSPCLGQGWADYGPAFVGVFALAASFLIQLIEILAPGHGYHNDSPPLARSHPSHGPPINQESEYLENLGQVIPVGHTEPLQLESQYHEQGKNLSTIILELGILFHSVVIGLTLGVLSDFDTFRTLLIAICFHQFFEGLALGALISKMNYSTWFKFLVPGLMYPLTTPIGIAIGISVHQYYNDNANQSIVIQGIFNSLSAGILLYNTYAELISTEINHNKAFRRFKPLFKFINMIVLYAGAAAMAVLAKWA